MVAFGRAVKKRLFKKNIYILYSSTQHFRNEGVIQNEHASKYFKGRSEV